MSYDLRVWGRKPGDLSACLSAKRGWTEHDGTWTLEKRSWQIVVTTAQSVEPEDVPPGAAELLPGVSVLVELSLEPVSAWLGARLKLRSIARSIAAEFAGLVEDPQRGSLALPRGEVRYEKPKPEKRFSVVELSWWFMESPLRTEGGLSEFLSILARHLPEAVPRRYGLWEPPEYKTDRTGIDALVSFMAKNRDAVFYPSRPVLGFSLSDRGESKSPTRNFRSNRFSLQVEVSALQQPGWEQALRGLWRDVSSFLRPFYGDVRVLSGYIRRFSFVMRDKKTQEHPVRASCWRGIPSTPALAFVLGPPYSQLWQVADAVRDGDLAFVEHPQWSRCEPLDLVVPADLAQRWDPSWVKSETGGYTVNWCDEYPATWPFSPGE